jgi:hypothetical protein
VAAGFMTPILGCLKNKKETLISERFHLGGIANLRGFQYKGLGDRGTRRDAAEPAGADSPTALTSDALGGDIYARVRAAVCTPSTQSHAGASGHNSDDSHVMNDSYCTDTHSGLMRAAV